MKRVVTYPETVWYSMLSPQHLLTPGGDEAFQQSTAHIFAQSISCDEFLLRITSERIHALKILPFLFLGPTPHHFDFARTERLPRWRSHVDRACWEWYLVFSPLYGQNYQPYAAYGPIFWTMAAHWAQEFRENIRTRYGNICPYPMRKNAFLPYAHTEFRIRYGIPYWWKKVPYPMRKNAFCPFYPVCSIQTPACSIRGW